MSIPGLQLPGLSLGTERPITSTSHHGPVPTKQQNLAKGTEYRFEVPFSGRVRIKVLSGNAELFGNELATNRPYAFTGVKAAIFTHHGCLLEIEGEPENAYVGEETEVTTIYNAHFALEDMRDAVRRNNKAIGPRVLLVGPDDCGKSALMKTLTSYAVRTDRQPTVVNLDPREGVLSVPGSLTAVTFSDILDIEHVDGWGSSPISGPSSVPVKMPLVYHFGSRNPDSNKTVYKALVTRLALAVTSRMEEDPAVRQGGCLIDSPGSISIGRGGSYDYIQHIVSEFSVNVIAIIGSERLYQDMRRLFGISTSPEDAIAIVRLPKSQGCVDREESFIRSLAQAQVRNYFFGTTTAPLSPYTQLVDFGQLSIYKVNETAKESSVFDPGADDDYSPSASNPSKLFQKVEPSMMLQNSILAITRADAGSSQDIIRDSSVLGYVYVADVDEGKRRVRMLSPVSGRIANNALIMGSWPEPVIDMMN